MLQRIGDLVQEVRTGIIVQQVNAQGYMGSGFAKALYTKYPLVKLRYHARTKSNQLDHGRKYLGDCDLFEIAPDLFVANIVGQQYTGTDGRRYTSYDALDRGFGTLARMIIELNDSINTIESLDTFQIHHPLIGAGLGGGNWNIISSIIEHHLGPDTILWTLQ